MRIRILVALLTCAVAGWLAPTALAHVRVRAIISFDPPRPVTDESCAVNARFETTTGAPVELQRVVAVGEMSGHAMRPVESLLEPAGAPGTYRGRMVFTMAGPWVVTIRADDGHGEVTGVASIEVAHPAPAADQEARLSAAPAPAPVAVQLDAPVSGPAWSPWTILLAALGLTGTAEAVAIARKLRRASRQSG